MNTIALLGPIGTPELIVIAFLGLLIFGKRLPEVFSGLGSGIRSFKNGLTGMEDEIRQPATESPLEPAPSQSTTACLESGSASLDGSIHTESELNPAKQ